MSSASADNIELPLPQVKEASGMYTDESGQRLFVLDNEDNTLYRYELSTPWSLNTAVDSGDSYTFMGDAHANMREVFFDPTGTMLYIINDNGPDSVYQHSLGVAWDLSTINPAFVELDIRPEGLGTCLYFGDAGSKMYVCGNNNHRVEQYNLGTPYDISTAALNQFLSISIASERVESLALSATGDKLFVYVDSDVRTYALASNWNVSSGSLEGLAGTYSPIGIGRARSMNLELYS